MNVSLAIESVENADALARVAREAADTGFHGIELPIEATGVLSLETSPSDCHDLSARVADAGLDITALALRRAPDAPHLASTDVADRRRALERALAALDRAAWLHTRRLVFTPVFLGDPSDRRSHVRYEEAYGRAVESLLALRFEAQQRGVHMVCAIRDTRFLLSPMEARTFIDRVNSPFVGLSLDLGSLLSIGYPEDWIASLGHRVFHVYLTDQHLGNPATPCGIGEGDVDWPAVGEALRAARFQGPVTLPSGSDPREALKRIALGVEQPAN